MTGRIPGVVLASTSRHRRHLMDRLGIEYRCETPLCNEDLPEGTLPGEGTAILAVRKARSVAHLHQGSLIVGSDQMAVLGGRVLGKPGSVERAVEQLADMSGRMHELWTSVAVLDTRSKEGPVVHTDVHCMWMRALGRAELAEYVAQDAPLDCAGSYRFESKGAALFERVEGEDPTAITGLPLAALAGILGRMGVAVPPRRP